jgi:hypothetical protein
VGSRVLALQFLSACKWPSVRTVDTETGRRNQSKNQSASVHVCLPFQPMVIQQQTRSRITYGCCGGARHVGSCGRFGGKPRAFAFRAIVSGDLPIRAAIDFTVSGCGHSRRNFSSSSSDHFRWIGCRAMALRNAAPLSFVPVSYVRPDLHAFRIPVRVDRACLRGVRAARTAAQGATRRAVRGGLRGSAITRDADQGLPALRQLARPLPRVPSA